MSKRKKNMIANGIIGFMIFGFGLGLVIVGITDFKDTHDEQFMLALMLTGLIIVVISLVLFSIFTNENKLDKIIEHLGIDKK